MTLANLTRWQAALIHLVLSAVIAAAVFGSMILLWYPPPYFEAAGGTTLIMIIVGVDVVVGPLLTLIVFDPRKKSLKWDLAIIVALQLAALAYGVFVMFQARPAYVAFVRDRFHLVAANDIPSAEQAKANPAFREAPLTGPVVVATRVPADAKEADRVATAALLGANLAYFPQHYIPYATASRDAAARAQPLSALRANRPDRATDIDRFVAKTGKPVSALRFLPLMAPYGDMSVVVDAETGDVLGVLAIPAVNAPTQVPPSVPPRA